MPRMVVILASFLLVCSCNGSERTMSLSAKIYVFLIKQNNNLFLPLVGGIPDPLRSTFIWLVKLILYLLLSKVSVALGYLLMDELTRAVLPFCPSGPFGGMDSGSGSCPPPSENWELLTASAIDDNKKGSPSLSEEFPCVCMPTPEFQAMITTIDPEPVLSSNFYPEPLLSDEERRLEEGASSQPIQEEDRALTERKQNIYMALSGLLNLNKRSVSNSYIDRTYKSLHLDQEKDPRILNAIVDRIYDLCYEHNGSRGARTSSKPSEVKKRLVTWLENLRKNRRPEDE